MTTPSVTTQYITVEPHWPGVRRYVREVFRTDPDAARRMAAAMGSEAPALPPVVPVATPTIIGELCSHAGMIGQGV